MIVSARVQNSLDNHQVTLTTNGQSQSLQISSKPTGFGSSVSGGELLFLALATCYCNDIYREAESQGIRVFSVEVEVSGEFAGIPATGKDVRVPLCVVYDLENDQIKQGRVYFEMPALLQQLGIQMG